MPSADQNLKIFLQVQADASQLAQINTGLAATAAEAEGAAAATSTLGSAFSLLGSALGGATLLGVGAIVGYLIQIPSLLSQAHEEQERFKEKIDEATQNLSLQVGIWDQLASGASKFGDVISLAGQGIKELTKLTQDLESAQGKQLTTLQKIEDAFNPGSGPHGGGGIGGNAEAKADATTAAQTNLEQGQQRITAAIRDGTAAEEEFHAALEKPTQEILDVFNSKLTTAKGILASIDPGKDLAAYKQAAELVQVRATQVDQIEKAQGKVTSDVEREATARKRIQDDLALKGAKLSGDDEAVAAAAGARAYDETLRTLGDIHGLKAENVALAKQEQQTQHDLVLAQQQHTTATGGTVNAHQQLRDLLGAERLQLDAIKADMANITSNPFLTVNQKDAALAQEIPQAMKKLNDLIDQNKTKLKGSALDPTQINAVRSAIQRDGAELTKLQIQLKQTTFSGQLQSSLVQWVNSFGTTAAQIGQTITSTIGTAINGVSNAITGAIFHTQSWGQAFAQVAQQIVGNLINIVLQWATQQAVMLALQAIFGQTAAESTGTAAAQVAAYWAPGATAASIATEGEADLAGIAALGSAMAIGQGIVTGTSAVGLFEKGGYNPGMGITHPGEYILDKTTVRRAGGPQKIDNWRVAINSPSSTGARSGQRGAGSVSNAGRAGGNGNTHFTFFMDLKKAMDSHIRSTATTKHFVDLTNSRGGHLRS